MGLPNTVCFMEVHAVLTTSTFFAPVATINNLTPVHITGRVTVPSFWTPRGGVMEQAISCSCLSRLSHLSIWLNE
jgi:hypothetical protein